MTKAIISPLGVYLTQADADAGFQLGQLAYADDGSVFVYCQANGAIAAAYEANVIDYTYQAVPASTTTTASAYGDWVGANQTILADNDYGWFQIFGPGSVKVLASAAACTALNSTGTAGSLDDDHSSGAELILGLVIGVADGGSGGVNATAFFRYPSVYTTY